MGSQILQEVEFREDSERVLQTVALQEPVSLRGRIDGNYNTTQKSTTDVTVGSGTTVNASSPGALQLLADRLTVTIEGGSLNSSGIRNAAILFGDDAYWTDFYNYGSHYDGTVTFTGANASLSSTVSNCINAAGIVGKNLTVNFSGAASGSGGITFKASNGTGRGNFASGITADENLTVNGIFGGRIDSSLNLAGIASFATVYGLQAKKNLTVTEEIKGVISAVASNASSSTAYGVYAGGTLSGHFCGTVIASAQNNAYGLYGSSLDIKVSGTVFAGKSDSATTAASLTEKLNNFNANKNELLQLSAGQNAIYGKGSVTVSSGALIAGNINLTSGSSNLTISSGARIYGNVTGYGNVALKFNIGTLLDTPVISTTAAGIFGSSSTAYALSLNNAQSGTYLLVSGAAADSLGGKIFTVTLQNQSANLAVGSSYQFTNGVSAALSIVNNTLQLVVSGKEGGGGGGDDDDTTSPVLNGLPGANTSRNNVIVSWNPASDDTGVAGYYFRYGTSSALSGNGITVSDTSYLLENMSNGTYYYQICAFDAAGNMSDWSAAQTFTVDYDPRSKVAYDVPEAEYMYGCLATAVGMMLGYYDRYGYMGYDVSNVINGTVEKNSRGLDGNKYNMNAFDTVMGSAIASREHVSHFYETTPEAELPYTYVGDSITLNTAEWNCIADYLGTNQYWRYNGDLSTSFYPDSTLASIKDADWEETITSGSTSKTIPPKYIDVKYGLELYLEQAGYQLDQVKTASHTTDNAGGTFTFEDYKAEIDAGRVVIIGITEHAMVGYGYDDATREIILDDTYDHDCRMKWGGTYYYSGEERQLEDIMTVVFDTTGLSQAAVPVNHDLNGDSRSDILMANSSGYAGTWFVQDDAPVWGNLSTLSGSWEILGTGNATVDGFSDVYLYDSAGHNVGAWVVGADGQVQGWEGIANFDSATQVLGLGDFNGDGISDFLLRNLNGAVGGYYTDGYEWTFFQSLGNEWNIAGIGDLNGDGIDDIVLQHEAGFSGTWLVKENGTVSWANLDTLDNGFKIAGTGDFNGDGVDDVLLQKGNYYGAWIVKDGSVSSWMGLGTAEDGNVLEQIGDFNGDGVDDLRVRTAAGDLGALCVMGTDKLEWNYYGSVGSEWKTSLAATV